MFQQHLPNTSSGAASSSHSSLVVVVFANHHSQPPLPSPRTTSAWQGWMRSFLSSHPPRVAPPCGVRRGNHKDPNVLSREILKACVVKGSGAVPLTLGVISCPALSTSSPLTLNPVKFCCIFTAQTKLKCPQPFPTLMSQSWRGLSAGQHQILH